jgi:hypothetical protein
MPAASDRTPLDPVEAIFGDAPPPPLRYEDLGLVRKALVTVFLAVGVWYLAWRPGWFNEDALVFSIAVYAAEVFGFAAAVLHLFMCWHIFVGGARGGAPPPAAAARPRDRCLCHHL